MQLRSFETLPPSSPCPSTRRKGEGSLPSAIGGTNTRKTFREILRFLPSKRTRSFEPRARRALRSRSTTILQMHPHTQTHPDARLSPSPPHRTGPSTSKGGASSSRGASELRTWMSIDRRVLYCCTIDTRGTRTILRVHMSSFFFRGSLDGHERAVSMIKFSPDGSR